MSENYQQLFGLPADEIYVNNAAVGLIPKTCVEAMNAFADAQYRTGPPSMDAIGQKFTEMRTHAGSLIGAPAEDMAFISNTTEGLSIALTGIDWQPGDNVIAQKDAFPAAQYILEYVLPQVEKRWITVGDGTNLLADLEKNTDAHTRAITLDYVNFLTGYRLDLAMVGEFCRQKQIFSVIDGIQANGACEVNAAAAGIDFYSGGGLKWLLSPMGTGIFYARPEAIEKCNPVHVGWLSAQWDDFSSFYPLRKLHPTAQRFEWANANMVGLWGLTASLELLDGIGITGIQRNIQEKVTFLGSELKKRGMTKLVALDSQNRSGIVSFKSPTLETAAIYAALEAGKVHCSQREGYIRIAIHFYNSQEQLGRILRLMDALG